MTHFSFLLSFNTENNVLGLGKGVDIRGTTRNGVKEKKVRKRKVIDKKNGKNSVWWKCGTV